MRTAPPVTRTSVPGTLSGKTLQDFEEIFAHATIAILVTDQQGYIAAVNEAATREFGYTADEMTGKHVEMLIPSRYRAEHRIHHSFYISKPHNKLIGQEMVGFTRNGQEIPLEIHLSNYWLGDAFYVIVFLSNISERKQFGKHIGAVTHELKNRIRENTRQLKASLSQLQKSQERFEQIRTWHEAIVSCAGSIIIATDEKGIIRMVNPAAELATGYKAAELIGKHTPGVLHDMQELAQFKKELQKKHNITADDPMKLFMELARINGTQGIACSLIRKDGSRLPVTLSITPIANEKGEPLGVLGVAIDISDRKKMEEELRRALEKEMELGEMKSRFISMASHEFRTPLSTVLSSAFLIGQYMKEEDQPQREVHLNRIISAVTMLTGILNDFMSAGRIEEGKIQVRPAVIRVPEWMQVTMKEMEGMLRNGQRFIYRHEGAPEVMTDAALLKQILINLVSNATKFSGAGQPVRIHTSLKDDTFSLEVKDQGIGISKADQAHLKERFFRSAAVEHIQGTGLGLHIVSRYTELLGGTMHCKSKPGAGSIFTVKIPVMMNRPDASSILSPLNAHT